jgi:transcription elongation factor Elf1
MLHGRVECPKCGDVKQNCICNDHKAFVAYVECGNCTRMASASADVTSLRDKIREILDEGYDFLVPVKTPFQDYLISKLRKIEAIINATPK